MSMNIAELTEFVEFDMPLTHTLCLQSNHGMGKSTVVSRNFRRALARRFKVEVDEVMVVDKRGSQMEPTDVIGTSWMVGGQTYNAPPAWIPIHHEDQAWLKSSLERAGREWSPFTTAKVGILFLDELLHADRHVLHAFFEMLNDHKANGLRFPENWLIVCAMNGDLSRYDGTHMGPALIDRLILVDFEPSQEEYLQYLEERVVAGEIPGSIPAFLRINRQLIDPDGATIDESTAEGLKSFSRRSWDRAGEMLARGAANGRDLQEQTIRTQESTKLTKWVTGYVGLGAATAYATFVRDEYGALSPEEIVHKFSDSTRTKLLDLFTRNPVAAGALNEQVVKFLGGMKKVLPDNVQQNITKYLRVLPREAAAAFWKDWCAHSTKTREQAEAWHTVPATQYTIMRAIAKTSTTDAWVKSMLAVNPNFLVEAEVSLP